MKLHEAQEGFKRAASFGILADDFVDIIGSGIANAVSFHIENTSPLFDNAHLLFGNDLLNKKIGRYPFPSIFLSFEDNKRTGLSIQQFSPDDCCKADYSGLFISTYAMHSDGQCTPTALALVNLDEQQVKHFALVKNMEYFERAAKLNNISSAKEFIVYVNDYGLKIAESFLSLTMSKNTYIELEEAPERLNRKRQRQGKLPIAEVRRIKIAMNEKLVSKRRQGGTHASPIMHWRRGHMRRLENGKIVPVAPTIVNASDEYKPLAKEYIVT